MGLRRRSIQGTPQTCRSRPPSSRREDYENTAEITASDASDPDSTPNNGVGNGEDDEATVTTTPIPVADLGITKTDGATSYTQGSTVTYQITVSNAGPSDVISATVSDPDSLVASGERSQLDMLGQRHGSLYPGPVVGDINDSIDLPKDETVTYTLLVDIDPGALGDLVNTATVSPPVGTTEPDATDNSATDTDTLVLDLHVAKTIDDATPRRGPDDRLHDHGDQQRPGPGEEREPGRCAARGTDRRHGDSERRYELVGPDLDHRNREQRILGQRWRSRPPSMQAPRDRRSRTPLPMSRWTRRIPIRPPTC